MSKVNPVVEETREFEDDTVLGVVISSAPRAARRRGHGARTARGETGITMLELDMCVVDSLVTQMEDALADGNIQDMQAVMGSFTPKVQDKMLRLQQAAEQGQPQTAELLSRLVKALRQLNVRGSEQAAVLLEQLGLTQD